ncbi:MAG: hypothetical protein RR929_03175 [Erysipelotrichaceae bacterium]
MKRFIADAILILIIISIAFNGYNSEETTLEHKQKAFEESISKNEPIDKQIETKQLNNIEDNLAVRLANAASEAIIDITSSSLGVIVNVVEDVLR